MTEDQTEELFGLDEIDPEQDTYSFFIEKRFFQIIKKNISLFKSLNLRWHPPKEKPYWVTVTDSKTAEHLKLICLKELLKFAQNILHTGDNPDSPAFAEAQKHVEFVIKKLNKTSIFNCLFNEIAKQLKSIQQ
jgi:hypothetical protein